MDPKVSIDENRRNRIFRHVVTIVAEIGVRRISHR